MELIGLHVAVHVANWLSVALEERALDRSARTGDVLAQQNMAQQKLYHVLEGRLQVYKNGHPIATVGEGDFAGEVIVAQLISCLFFLFVRI